MRLSLAPPADFDAPPDVPAVPAFAVDAVVIVSPAEPVAAALPDPVEAVDVVPDPVVAVPALPPSATGACVPSAAIATVVPSTFAPELPAPRSADERSAAPPSDLACGDFVGFRVVLVGCGVFAALSTFFGAGVWQGGLLRRSVVLEPPPAVPLLPHRRSSDEPDPASPCEVTEPPPCDPGRATTPGVAEDAALAGVVDDVETCRNDGTITEARSPSGPPAASAVAATRRTRPIATSAARTGRGPRGSAARA